MFSINFLTFALVIVNAAQACPGGTTWLKTERTCVSSQECEMVCCPDRNIKYYTDDAIPWCDLEM